MIEILKDAEINDPYVRVSVDLLVIGKTLVKQKTKTSEPVWNEEIVADILNGVNMEFIVFSRSFPPDEFVANRTVTFKEIYDSKTTETWVSLFIIFKQHRVCRSGETWFVFPDPVWSP